MTLSEFGDFNDGDRHSAGVENIHNFDVYDEQNEKIGQVVKAEMAELEHSPYLIIKVGSWLASRQVLLPLRSYQVDLNAHRINISGWSREEVNQLPNYPIRTQIEDAYATLETSTSLESGAALEAPIMGEMHLSTAPVEITDLLQAPMSAFTTNETANRFESSAKILDEEIIPLLAERVIVDRHKRKSGEVVIRKVIETEVIEVVVRREKLIVEQVSPEYKELAVIDLGRTSVEETPPSQAKDNDF
jgi:stress response protein YsnF